MEIITQSRLRSKATCGIRYNYEYEQNLKSAFPSPTVNRGFLFHEGAAVYLWTLDPAKALEAVRLAYEKQIQKLQSLSLGITDEDYENFYHDYSVAHVMLNGWIKNFGVPRPIKKITGVEIQFSFEFFTAMIAGKIDGVALDENGRPVIIEWKTSTATGESFKNMLMLDWQTLFYAWALEQVTGTPVNNAHFFIIKQPSIRPCAEESNEQYFERLEAQGIEIPTQTVKGEIKKVASAALKGAYPKKPESKEQYRARIIQDYENRPDFYFQHEWVPLDENLKKRVTSWVRAEIAHIESAWTPTPPWDMRVCEKCWYKRLCTGQAEIGIDFIKRDSAHEELTEIAL